ncbi:hypothetical protein [Streptomyces flaveolus]|uniref:Uncharacterized protein n=1 Tax=Streptomyces flaveolus TaxID=67297 RepID=A0ABV3A9B9_9ACTN
MELGPITHLAVNGKDMTDCIRTEPSPEEIARWLRDPANREAVLFVLRREARVDPTWLVNMLRAEARRQGGRLNWLRRF